MQDRRDNGRKNYPPPTAYMSPAAHHRKRTGVLNLYLTLGVSIAAALAALLSVNVFFGLNAQNIQVSGTDLYTAEQIQFVGGMADGQNLIRLNTDFIANRLKKSLVYVDDVTVEKHYPDSLSVTITQAKEAADIKTKSGWCTVSQSGRVLSANPERVNTKLPEVVGYELKSETAGDKAESTDAQKTEILGDLFDRMNSLGMKNIKKIDITDRTDIKLNYDNRIEIQLGSSVDLDIKLTYIKTVLDKGLPESYEGTLRYNGIDSGISAIPKQADVPSKTSSKADSSSSADSSAAEAYADGTASSADSSTDTTTDNGWGYGDQYDQNYDTGYDQGNQDYTDQNWGYDYGDGYSYDYGDGGYSDDTGVNYGY